MLLSTSLVFGQSADEQAVRQTLAEVASAMQSNDVTALDHFWANDYTFIGPNGVTVNKAERIADIRSKKLFKTFTYENPKLRIYGNTAVVNTNAKNTLAGGDTYAFNVTLTMVKNNGSWQIVAAHATQLTDGQSGANDEQTLIRIEDEMVDALIKGDPAANERYLADAYIFTGPNGIIGNKTEGIAALKSGDLKFVSSKLDDMKVQIYGDAASVTYGTTDKGQYKGNDVSGKYRWTDVFVKQGGQWRMVATQGTRLAQQK